MGRHRPVSAVELAGARGRQEAETVGGLGVTVTVGLGGVEIDCWVFKCFTHLCSSTVYEGVAVIAAEQLGHRNHGHVLLQAEVCIDEPGELTP